MRVIHIGDIHGHDSWKKVIAVEADKYIFHGDYVDSQSISSVKQLENLHDIISFARNSDKEVILLKGNHDMPYMHHIDLHTSGINPHMIPSFGILFRENQDLFKMAYEYENVICTHAGISSNFLNETGIEDNIVEQLNSIPPICFSFGYYLPLEYLADPGGDDVLQGPTWIRQKSLIKSNIGKIQVFGHTNDIHVKNYYNKFYCVDSLPYEFLIYEDGIFTPKILS